MYEKSEDKSWVTFCMSTYKRPVLLKNALETIAKQTFQHYEVVISDNDPDCSARAVVEELNDFRFKYFPNGENLGMIQSFNKSIERADTDYIVMITDDDPVTDNFLKEIFELYSGNPGYSIYCGFIRKNTNSGTVEIIGKDDFIVEILDVDKTPVILWSSCVMKKSAVIQVGKMPDNGSPHLADHALIAMVGGVEGGVVINKMYSKITLHDNNFSKFSFQYYVLGCKGFYEQMIAFCKNTNQYNRQKQVIIKHIGKWFIVNIFNLKKFYTIKGNKDVVKQINDCAKEIMSFPFMRPFVLKYYAKASIFYLKKRLNVLK